MESDREKVKEKKKKYLISGDSKFTENGEKIKELPKIYMKN